MKTFLVMYMLAFVSIIVLYVYERDLPSDEHFEPHAMAAQVMRREAAGVTIRARPVEPDTSAVPKEKEKPEAVAAGRDNLPEIVDFDHYPHTFEGLDQKIKEYSASAKVNPDLYVNISQCYFIKAAIYQARIRSLRSLGPGEKSRAVYEELERKRVNSLKLSLDAVRKAPRTIYKNTDTRYIKALIYRQLPGQEVKAIPELEKLADDPDALPRLRESAREFLERASLRD